MKDERVTIGVINYNGRAVLPLTLNALQALQYPAYEVVVVDNKSTDGSREWLLKCHPEIRCICLCENLGLPGARNVLLEQATTDYIFIIDNDIAVESDCLARLMDVMRHIEKAGVCHPEIRDDNDPDAYHYNGGWIHYLCTSISRKERDSSQALPVYEVFSTVSGAALLMNRQRALVIGGFDADYFFNWEDGDFTSRLTLAGYLCLNIPAAVVYHRSKPRGTSKVFYQVRNRWYFIIKLYGLRTLVLIAPMLLIFEFLQAGFCLKKGAFRDYLKGTRAAFRDLPLTVAKRKAFQSKKKLSDRDWLKAGEMYIPRNLHKSEGVLNTLEKAFYALCNGYWLVIKKFC